MEELPSPVVPVLGQRRLGPVPAAKAHGLCPGVRAGWVLVGVVEGEAEALGQCQGLRMLGVDELGVLLDALPIGEVVPQRPDPPARDDVVLIDVRLDPMAPPQRVGASEAGNAGTHDHDARSGIGWPRTRVTLAVSGPIHIGAGGRAHCSGQHGCHCRCARPHEEATSGHRAVDQFGRFVHGTAGAPRVARGHLGSANHRSRPTRSPCPHCVTVPVAGPTTWRVFRAAYGDHARRSSS